MKCKNCGSSEIYAGASGYVLVIKCRNCNCTVASFNDCADWTAEMINRERNAEGLLHGADSSATFLGIPDEY